VRLFIGHLHGICGIEIFFRTHRGIYRRDAESAECGGEGKVI